MATRPAGNKTTDYNPEHSVRVELKDPLAGCYLVLRTDLLTYGFLEDFIAAGVVRTRELVEEAVIDSNLPKGHAAGALRLYTVPETAAVFAAVAEAIRNPQGDLKSSG